MEREGVNKLTLDNDAKEYGLYNKNQKLNEKNRNLFKNTLEESILRQKRIGKAAKDETEINKVKLQNRIDSALNKVASFFGIGANLMKGILESIGISPEELIDENKRDIIIKELAKHFRLNEKQKEELLKVLKGC